MNWTGHVLAGPRTRLEAALDREELKRTGVYILFGSDGMNSDLTTVYVGESDAISKRLYQHNRDESKSFWERFIAVTSKDLNLTKAHVKYLEARLLDLLHAAKKSVVANKDNPDFDRLPEADTADMENFLSQIELVLPVIGADFLKRPRVRSSIVPLQARSKDDTREPESSARFKAMNVKAGIDAVATEIDGEFIVLAGSTGSFREKSSFSEKVKAVRDNAIETGRVVLIGREKFKLVEDVALNSPSAAAVFLFGTSRNGRTDWIEEDTGKTYGEWKADIIDKRLQVAD